MRAFKIEEVDIQVKVSTNHDNTYRVIQIKIGNGIWQEAALPAEIVKERVTDGALLRHMIKFFIKE